MNVTYNGMSSRPLITRVRERMNFKSLPDSTTKNHILLWENCSNNRFNDNNFLGKFKSELCFKNHKALLIKSLVQN